MSQQKETPENVVIGHASRTTGQIKPSINDFFVVEANDNTVIYRDDEGYSVQIKHHKSKSPNCHHRYILTLHDTDGGLIHRRTIKHGPRTDRDISDATDAIETQLWEWARYSLRDRFPVQSKIEALGEPNPHPPGEKPTVSNAWYYSYTRRTKCVNNEENTLSSRGTYVPTSRYEFMASNDSANWYCAQLIVSFNHEPPRSIEVENNVVYGTYIYLSFTPLKPVDERLNRYDTRKINRRCIHHDDPDESLPQDDLVDIITDAQTELQQNAEAIGDKHRQKTIAEAERRLNEETGEYEDQTKLVNF